jgi:hypothetical protein
MSEVKITLLAKGGTYFGKTFKDSNGNDVELHSFYMGNAVDHFRKLAEKAEQKANVYLRENEELKAKIKELEAKQ